MLQHPPRQVTADGFEHVVGDAHLGELGDDRVPQIVKPQTAEAGAIPQGAPGTPQLRTTAPERSRAARPSNSRSAKTFDASRDFRVELRGKAWLRKEPLHRIFDFQCQRCRLLSNVAFDVRLGL